MKIAHFDCFSGISGDMFAGALIDAGLDFGELSRELHGLSLPGFRVRAERVTRRGLSATHFIVDADETNHHRDLAAILSLINSSSCRDDVKRNAAAIFERLAQAEARAHGISVDEVNFHEVGAIDSIVDIVAAAAAVRLSGIDRVYASAIPLGGGTAATAHGPIPIPAPATLALLEGVPVCEGPCRRELTTPTGAAIISHFSSGFGPIPAMRLTASGTGAGTADLDHPNVLRVLIGEAEGDSAADGETVILFETNIDDMNPEFYDHVTDRLFEAGALDVFITPVIMKKFRPAAVLSVLGTGARADDIENVLFSETTTAGIRVSRLERRVLGRSFADVGTPYGTVRVKILTRGGRAVTVSPELDACRAAAAASGAPLKDVYAAARSAADNILAAKGLSRA